MSLKAPFRSYKRTDDRDWPICCSLLDAESTGFGPKRLRCSVPRFVCKMSLKAPFRSYKRTDDRDWPICCSLLDAESTGFGPKRLRCSVPPLFPIEHG